VERAYGELTLLQKELKGLLPSYCDDILKAKATIFNPTGMEREVILYVNLLKRERNWTKQRKDVMEDGNILRANSTPTFKKETLISFSNENRPCL